MRRPLVGVALTSSTNSGFQIATLERPFFRVRLDELPTDLDNTAYRKMAEQTEGVSSADIAGIVDDAAMRAAERDADELTLEDLHMSLPDQARPAVLRPCPARGRLGPQDRSKCARHWNIKIGSNF